MRETCTPTLGQSETCETCQHRFHEVSIKHAETGQHRCHKVSIKCAQGFFPRWTKATGTYIHNQVTQVRHGQTWLQQKQTSLPHSFYQTGTKVRHAKRPRQCHQVPRLPRKWNVNVTKCHACHAKRRWMSPSATPATQMERQCHQAPRLPRKVAQRPGRLTAPKRGTRAQPSATSATPAMQMEGQCCVTKSRERVWEMVCERVCERWCVKESVWQSGERCCVTKLCVWKIVCDKDGVWKRACDTVVCERWCVTNSCERECVKDGVWKRVCDKVVKAGVWQSCVCERGVCDKVVMRDKVVKMVCDKVVCGRWCVKDGVRKESVWQSWCVKGDIWQSCAWQSARGGRDRERDTESKRRTPHKDVEKMISHPHGPRRWAYSVIWNGLSIASPNHGFLNVP